MVGRRHRDSRGGERGLKAIKGSERKEKEMANIVCRREKRRAMKGA